MLKLFDRLGEAVLTLLRFVFLTKAARQKLDTARRDAANVSAPVSAAAAEPGDGEATRRELIARAVSLHREKQDVLSKLDDRTRRKLTSMAQRMMSPPPGKKRR